MAIMAISMEFAPKSYRVQAEQGISGRIPESYVFKLLDMLDCFVLRRNLCPASSIKT